MPRYPTHCTWCGCPVNTWTKGCEGCYTRFRSRYTRGVISSEEFEKLRAKYRPRQQPRKNQPPKPIDAGLMKYLQARRLRLKRKEKQQ
nr:MAG TPA: Short C-terminal domain [Caudoviricetes sp.]